MRRMERNETCKALEANKAVALLKIKNGRRVRRKGQCGNTVQSQASLPCERTQTSPLQHISIHISRTMSGMSEIVAKLRPAV